MKKRRMNRYFKGGITGRMVFWFTILVVVPYLLLGVLTYVSFLRYSFTNFGEMAEDSMSVAGAEITEALKNIEKDSMSLYYSGCVDMIESSKENNRALSDEEKTQITKTLDARCYSGYGVRSAYLTMGDGDTVLHSGGNFPELLELMKPYKEKIIETGGDSLWYPTNQLRGKSNSNKYILAKSLNGKKEKNIGILYLIADESLVTDVFERLTARSPQRYLTDEKGRVLYASDAAKSDDIIDITSLDTRLLRERQKVELKEKGGAILVSYQIRRTGWHCISILDMDDLSKDVFHSISPFVIIGIVYIGFMILMLRMMKKYVFMPLRKLKKTMDEYASEDHLEEVRMEAVQMELVGVGEFESLSSHFNHMSERIYKLMQDYKAETDEKNRQKMMVLTSQLTPHFIYNALNTIKWMAVLNHQDNIQRLTESLVYIFMNAVKVEDENYTVRDELFLIENYAVIQKARFMSFELMVEKEEECLDCRIRKLLVQPIVENAIVHGLGRGKVKNGVITIKIWRNEQLYIRVQDKGVGFDVEKWRNSPGKKEHHTNIGIRNVEQIIQMEYGSEYGMDIESIPGKGTTITYRLPILKSTARIGKEKTDDIDNYCG